MRISDWSSDVCSSDLSTTPVCRTTGVALAAPAWGRPRVPVSPLPDFDPFQQQVELGLHRLLRLLAFLDVVHRVQHAGVVPGRGTDDAGDPGAVVAVAGGGVVGMPAVEDPVPFVAVLVVHRRGGD